MTILYAILLGAFWANFAGMLGFSSVYLLDCGLTSTQIGMVVAASSLIAAVLQPIAGGYADKENAPSLKVITAVIVLAAFISALFIPVFYRRSAFFSGLFYGTSIMFLQFLLPFVTALGTETMSRGIKLNWGVSRAAGSLFYAITSFLVGQSVARFGVLSIPTSIVICYGLLLISVLIFPFSNEKKQKKDEKQVAEKGEWFFRKYPRFGFVVLGVILLFTSYNYMAIFMYQIVASKGGTEADVGTVLGMCAIFEMPCLMGWDLMLKKIKCQGWMKICAVFITLKAALSLIVPTMTLFYPVQLTQLLGFGLLAIAPIYYTLLVIDKKNAIKGQAYMALTNTVGSVIASMTGGRIIDSAGVNTMLSLSITMGVLGALLIFIFVVNKTEEPEPAGE